MEHYIDKKYNTRTEQNKNFDIKYDDKKFSLKAPVEETKDLIAIHNITEEKLKGTLELGGFPVPSIAITKAEQGHDNFGDISVIFTKDTIDPEFIRKNKVFTQDIYSKRIPAIKNRQTNTQFEKINDIFMPYFERLEQSIRSYSNKWEDTNIDDAVYELSRQTAVKMAYLDSKGIETKIPYKKKALNRISEEAAKSFWKKHKNVDEVDLHNNRDKWNDAVREVLAQDRKAFEEKTGKKYPGEELSERLTFAVYDRTVWDLLKRKNGIAEKEIDIDKISETVNKKVNPKIKEFENWLRDTISPYFGDKYFRDDNERRRDYTLENLTQYMKGDIKNQEKTLVYGLGQVIASTGQELTSIADIKKASTNLTDSETRAKYKAELEAFDENVRSMITKKRINSRESFFDVFEDYYKALTQFLGKKKSAKSALSSNGFRNVTDEMLNQFREVGKRIKETPPEYFEAKPQRAVGFDEVAAIVAPKRTDKELLQQLKDRAIKVVRYDSKIEGDRLKKINSVKGVKFSLKDSQGRDLTQEQAEYFKDSKVRDENGNLQVVYHGTFNEFYTFAKGDIGYHFGTDKAAKDRIKSEREWGGIKYIGEPDYTMPVYLDIKNPIKMPDVGTWGAWAIISELNTRLEYTQKGETSLDGYFTPFNKAEMNELEDLLDSYGVGKTYEEASEMWYNKLKEELYNKYGIDGIVYENKHEDKGSTSYIAFSPEQIKSIDNLNPTKDKDIRYSVKDSKGNELSEQQAEFFKDSKVRDENGNLQVVYHGTDGNFTIFKKKGGKRQVLLSEYNVDSKGFFFATDKNYAESFGKRVGSYYINITNPLIYKNMDFDNANLVELYEVLSPLLNAYEREGIFYDREIERFKNNPTEFLKRIIPNNEGLDWTDIDYPEFNDVIKSMTSRGYDGILVQEGIDNDAQDVITSWFVINPEQIKSIDNFNPTNVPDIRYQLKDMTLKNDTAKYTPERLENILSRYGSKSSPNYSQAYVAHMSPDEFLSLTTTNLSRIESESRKLNLEDLQNETQEIFLRFDIDDKEVTGHEGRHRMVALRDAGVKSVPVVLWQDGEKDKYNKTLLKSLKLAGEEFANNKAPGNVEMKNLVPASRAYEKTLARDFVDAKGETAVRFQLRDNKSAKDVEKLQNTVTRLKEQFKLTKGVKLDEKAVRKFSKTILKDYGSKYSSSELEVKLYNVYMGMVNGTMEYDEAHSIINEAAREIIENASILNDAMYRQYSELRNTMRNTAISIDDRYKGDFDAVGGWNDFRKRNFGRMNTTSDGMSIDKLYQELSDSYPELFLEDIANPADQLMLISDVLDNLVPIYENPYNRDLNEAVEYLALEIFDGMTSVPEAKPTFADRKKAEKQKAIKVERDKSKARVEALKNKNVEDVAWLKYQNKEKLKGILEKEKAKRDEAVAKVKKQYQDKAYKTWWRNKLKENDIKSHYQEMIKELRISRDEKLEQQKTKYKERISGIYEDRKIRQAKDRIRTMAKKLGKMLRSPTQKQHIPKALDKTIAELLTMLDFTTDRQKETTQIKLRDLRAEYEKLAKVSDEDGLSATADPYIVEALEMLHNKRIAEMNLQEIELLRDIVSYFENMVKTYNKAFLGDKWIDVSTKAEGIIKDLETDTPMNESAYGGILYFKDMMNWGMLTPQMFFERMGNTFNSLYDDFRAALDKKINSTKIAQDYMSDLLKNSKDKISQWTGKKAEIKTVKLDSGKTIELTQSQLMSFYLLMKREQARGHIFGLGIKAAPIVAVDKKGMKYVKKQFEPVKITLDDATKMIAMLSKEQRRIADGIGKFMNTYSKKWVNEATLQNYGYELAKEENYFPIKVDRDFLKSDFDNTNLDPTFTSMGFLKATIKGAGNAIILEDVFDVFTEHADKAATYNAFVGVTESTKKIVNYKTQDNSIKQAMNKKFGIQAFNYLKKFMVDLQGGIRTESGSPVVTGLIRKAKRAVLGLNLRTIIQQPTAIVRASALIDADYLIKGVAMKSDKAEMLEKSPIARWKSWGYFNLDTGRSMKDIILDSVPLLDKQYQGMQIADDITWTKIWNAVKLEIENNEPGLKVGSAEYFDAVNYRFNEIIDRTQVVDTVMHRSDSMRQSDSSWKILTAFMSEPTKSYNLLLNAVEKYNANKSVENKKVLLRTFSAWTATMLVNTFVISMLDMWRRKEDDKETFKDKWIDNILNDVTGYVPIVRDIYSLFEGYSVKRMEYNGIERIVRSINRSKKYIEEMAEDEKHSYPLRLITKDWIESVAYVFGVGALNVSKDLEALLRNYTRWIDDEGAINEIYEFMFKK
ncbi:MAG: hypothetical protein WC996_04040 [Peptostreptococcales bacterium]